MTEQPINMLCWNVRGLNCPDRRATVKATIEGSSCHLICLQETKLSSVNMFTAASIGGFRFRGFAQRPAIGTREASYCSGMRTFLMSMTLSQPTTVCQPLCEFVHPKSASRQQLSMAPRTRLAKMLSLRRSSPTSRCRIWHGSS